MTDSHTASPASLEPERRYALVIAVGKFTDPALRELSSTVADAISLSDLLQDPAIGGYEVTTVLNQSASEASMQIDRFFQERASGDLAMVYISTHGVLDARGRLFFAMSDTRREYLASTALAAEFIRDRMDDSRARQMILMLDTSFSGAFTRGVK